jgi:hypothetical protein
MEAPFASGLLCDGLQNVVRSSPNEDHTAHDRWRNEGRRQRHVCSFLSMPSQRVHVLHNRRRQVPLPMRANPKLVLAPCEFVQQKLLGQTESNMETYASPEVCEYEPRTSLRIWIVGIGERS